VEERKKKNIYWPVERSFQIRHYFFKEGIGLTGVKFHSGPLPKTEKSNF
jgi:hypothetical protein